jgi:hypothetical protein
MKKVFFLIALTIGALVSCNTTKAQTIQLSGTNAVIDTITNAGTIYFKTAVGSSGAAKLATLKDANYRFYFTATNISGTSTFTVVQEGSQDGVTWQKINNLPGTDGYCSDTLSVSSVTTAVVKTLNSTVRCVKYVYGATQGSQSGRYLYLRLRFVGTGTQSTQIKNVYVITY